MRTESGPTSGAQRLLEQVAKSGAIWRLGQHHCGEDPAEVVCTGMV